MISVLNNIQYQKSKKYMQLNKYYIFIVIIFYCSFHATDSNAFDSDYVHLLINESAMKQSCTDSYLTINIDHINGIEKFFNGKPALEWIMSGGKKEDEGIRWFNHFHDPLKPDENAGLWGLSSSSLSWAQNSENNASWSGARQLFYDALTTGAEESFAQLFLSMGQIAHLVADKAVPAHIRNDAHPETQLYKIWEISHFEVWTKIHHDNPNLMDYSHGIRPAAAIFNNYQPVELASSPIARLWDTNLYTGDNPEVTLNGNIGLAEFTNANFFSENTVFSDKYPHPHYDDLIRTQTQIPDPFEGPNDPMKTVAREYWIKPAAGDLPSYRASGVGYNTFYLDELYIDGFKQFETFPPLDKYVFQDYAGILIPRAVGYAAALIDYFFRGRLDLQVGGITYGEGSSITGAQFRVRNVTPSQLPGQAVEPMENGELDLVCGFIPADGDTKEYHLVESVYSILNAGDPVNSEHISMATPLNIPAGARDISFTLVFRGKLGDEADAVAAQVFTFNNSRIAYYHQPGGQPETSNIFTSAPDGSDPYQVTDAAYPNPWYFAPAWSKDGTVMAFERERCTDPNPPPDGMICSAEHHFREIVGIDLLSGLQYPDNVQFELNYNGDSVGNASFSPDGTKIAALKRTESGFYYYGSLVVFDLASNNQWIVNEDDDPHLTILWGSRPAWSPAGDKIAYYLHSRYDAASGTMKLEQDLFLIDPYTGEKIRLTNDEFNNTQPAWSPDGERIVFSSDRDGQASMDIWLMDKDGENLARLVDCTPASCYSPTFSPDGRQVAFSNGSRMFTISSDGDPSSLEEIANPGSYIGELFWSPFLVPPAFLDVQAEPRTITAGGTSILSWQSDRATEVYLHGIAEKQPPDGSIVVSPGTTTTYTLKAVGPTGSGETTVTVRVE